MNTLQSSPKEHKAPTKVEIGIKGQFIAQTGYAKANRNLAFGLASLGADVSIQTSADTNEGFNELELRQLEMFIKPWSDKAILIDSCIPSFANVPNLDHYCILATTVESTVPQQFVDACSNYNEIWVPSDFCKEMLVQAGVSRPVFVIPNSININCYNRHVPPHVFEPKLKSFAFLSVFGWNWRKGYDALLRAYLQEFNGDDDVSLLLVSRYEYDMNGNRVYKIDDEIKNFVDKYGGNKPAHIARLGHLIPEFEMPRIYRACQCFVLPSRGEGFGIPYLEASACGLPVIATNYSGQTMFLNENNSHLLPVDSISEGNSQTSGVHYWIGQKFPQLNSNETIATLGKMMRYVKDNYQSAYEKGKNLRQAILERYTIPKVSALALDRLETIWKSL